MPVTTNAPTGPIPEASPWPLRLRLLYRAYRYRWKIDRAEIAFVRANTRAGTIALDIGAHKGGYTYWLARKVGPDGRVYSFEPQPELARKLRLSFDPERVVVENAGVSDSEGSLRLHVPTDGRPSPGASLEAPAAASRNGHSIEVRVVSLDHYLRDRAQPVSFLKCDVEGHELHVFRGAEQLLRRDRPVLLFECEQRHHGARPVRDVFNYLENLGYMGRFFHRGQLLPLAQFRADQHQNASKPADYCNNFAFSP